MNVALISYASAAAAYAMLAALLLTSWRGRVQGIYLLLPVMATSVWAAFSAFHALQGATMLPLFIVVLELVKTALWVLFAIRMLTPDNNKSSGDKVRHWFNLWLIIIAGELLILFGGQFFYSNTLFMQLTLMGFVALPVFGLVLLEQLYRNTHSERRWAIKYLCIGLGGLFAYDLYLFTEAMLFSRIDEVVWNVRGIIYAVLMPLLAIGVARNPQWSFDIFISRRLVFHSAALVASGCYLLLMAAGGYYLKYFGGDWGRATQILFLFAALLILVLILFSGQFRSRLRVFITKHFFNYKYDYRDEWLRFTQRLSEVPAKEVIMESVLRAIAELVDSPAGVLWLADDDKGYAPVAQVGLEGLVPDRLVESESLVCFIADSRWVINMDEYQASPARYEGLEMPAWLLAIERAWLMVPLVEGGRLFGMALLARPRVERSFNWEDSDLLKTAGQQAAVYLAQYKVNQALMDARQFEAFNQFSTFIIHDIKNMVAQLSLMVKNAEKHRHNPDFIDDMIETTQNSVSKLEKLIAQLRTGKRSVTQPANKQIDLARLVTNVVADKAVYQPAATFSNEVSQDLFVSADSGRLKTIIGHLLQNAIDATSASGTINVILFSDNHRIILKVIDSGCGMDEQFIRERLFKPFDTTKGSAGMGIGVYESRDYIRKIGGSLSVESTIGVGTTFIVSLPLSGVQMDNEQIEDGNTA